MRTSLATLAFAGVLLFVFAVAQARRCPDVPAMTEAARNGDTHAIEELRSYGPGGLKSFIEFCQEDLERYRASAAEGVGRFGAGDRWAGLVKAIDAIAGQYDAAWSELYWFTDFERAKELAQRSGKPILSLRLLGRLDEELSCANSRFFRSTLYANETVAALLRDRFILHWESVRPAPVITIDYGDGRTLKTTITGNSIHYVLTPDGEVIDALPGLWSAQDFARTLKEAADEAAWKSTSEYWARQIAAIEAERKELNLWPPAVSQLLTRASARAAGLLATSKAGPEFLVLNRMADNDPDLNSLVEAKRWRDAANASRDIAIGDKRSFEYMLAMSSRSDVLQASNNRPIMPTLGQNLSVDSLRNRLDLRLQVLSGLTAEPELADSLNELNDRVYDSVFKTPKSDPWLGMFDPSRFTGLWGGPAHEAPTQQAMLAR